MNHDPRDTLETLDSLRQRCARLARDNAQLRLTNRMLNSLHSIVGLENLVERILNTLMETIGGANIVLFHAIDGKWRSADIYGRKTEAATLTHPLVRAALELKMLVREKETSLDLEFIMPQSEQWAFPLIARDRPIGGVVLEGIQLLPHAISEELNSFFSYAALMLDAEISSYSMLAEAHARLLESNRELQREIEARRTAEEQYRTIFEQSPDGIVLVDPETMKGIDFNRTAASQLGYTDAEFAGLSISDIGEGGDGASVCRQFERVLEKGHDTFETRQLMKNGKVRNILVTAKKLNLGGRPLLHCIFRDITEYRKMEDELLKKQKLESLGVLAGGIAHDFNNLLTAILGNTSLARLLLTPGTRPHQLLSESEKACTRAKDLTRQLLTFSKGGQPLKKLSAVGELIRESGVFITRGSRTRCEFQIPDELWSVEIDEGQISQVLHNLVINAQQAMDMGGTIHIACNNRHFPAGRQGSLPAGDYVTFSVRDQGCGMPAELVEKIFDPFFTTKQQGTGLGLSTSYSIIKNHNGIIDVDSTPGAGSTFTVYLPALRSGRPQPATAAHRPACSGKRILVMDDEEMVRVIICAMLGELGHKATVVADGTEAAACYGESMLQGRTFDCVILDLTVPGGVGGAEALERLLELDPGVKALVSSGYVSDSTISEYREKGFMGVLAKPYSIETLEAALREIFSV